MLGILGKSSCVARPISFIYFVPHEVQEAKRVQQCKEKSNILQEGRHRSTISFSQAHYRQKKPGEKCLPRFSLALMVIAPMQSVLICVLKNWFGFKEMGLGFEKLFWVFKLICVLGN